MQAIRTDRREFLVSGGAFLALLLSPGDAAAIGSSSRVELVQISYAGGNWRPRPTALRRLAWEIHKRTAVRSSLEPGVVKPTVSELSTSPLAYLSGDRPFTRWSESQVDALSRFLRLGGTLIVDPAHTPDGDVAGLSESFDELLEAALPDASVKELQPGHLVFRTFYDVPRALGRVEGTPGLIGYARGDRLAVIRTRHDLGGAWARDNLGNWIHEVVPGGGRQRESAFRLGINLIMYSLCQDYKDEEPHRRFGRFGEGGD
jgi:hypothetical protein